VLIHLPQRDQVIERLVSALAPGGWLMLEEFDSRSVPACPEPTTDAIPVGRRQRATTGHRSRRPDRAFPLEETEAALRAPRDDPEAIKPMVVPGR
jgi:hypothetical protein